MLRTVIAPILGGVIGYITNDLAIRMLFRPRKSIYIGRFHIPFTPGLIPQQKPRIARSVGAVVSSQLLDADTLKQTILSEQTIAMLKDRITTWLHTVVACEQRTVGELIRQYSNDGELDERITDMQAKTAQVITRKLIQADAGMLIVDALMQYINDSGTVVRLARIFVDENLQKNTRQKLAAKANELIESKAPDILFRLLDKTKADCMDRRVCDVYAGLRDREDRIVEEIEKIYVNVLGSNLDRLLKAVNVEQIVVEKINSFSAEELEGLIFGIMKRELRAIVYLGAALGFLMGFLNLLL